ncbi:hypothetical protein [Xenorhabdus kozodoii]|uniref:Uncharacterized protein n=1 Tax=Xenorhabdus kozodoii TaxID=351676 RepID=A0A2D0KVX1_9GAMM|nr:hypothetical protein [Xenorhabdus kozodoii]PHM67551.1 hypothetical protein Xkoz_03808 [Xenorhabdus kozodoii]
MNQLDQHKFDKLVEIVDTTLNSLSVLFEEFGIEGMHKLTDPSLDQLKQLFSYMKEEAENLEKDLESNADSMNSVTALMFLQNVKQGLLFADTLLIGIEKFDAEYCERAHNGIRSNSLVSPQW